MAATCRFPAGADRWRQPSPAAAHWRVSRASAYERALAIQLRGLGHELARDYSAAASTYREALGLWRSLSPKNELVAVGLSDLADALRELGQLAEAETHYREALVIAKSLYDAEGVLIYTGNLAEVALDRGQWPEAERLSRDALKLAEEVGRKDLIAGNCRRLAKALARQGRGAEGRYHGERAVAIFTGLRSPGLVEAKAALDECLA